jgi:hypothetical protein
LYLFTNNIYVITMIGYNIAKPWREWFWTNPPLVFAIIFALFYNHVLLFWSEASWVLLFDPSWLPNYYTRWVIFGTSWGFGVVIIFLQKVVFEPLAIWLIMKYPQKKWL